MSVLSRYKAGRIAVSVPLPAVSWTRDGEGYTLTLGFEKENKWFEIWIHKRDMKQLEKLLKGEQ